MNSYLTIMTTMRSLIWLTLCWIVSPIHGEEIDFNRDIRPILSDKCVFCHGPDKEQRQADLRLDTQEGALADLGGYAAIKPGDPAASELIKRIQSTDEYEQMPPPDSKRSLSAEEKQMLIDWIKQGAQFQEHWSLVKPGRPELPKVTDPNWPQNGVDHFILKRLEEQEMLPSSRAEKETLIRRVTLDLTGLPPTLEEVDAFLKDDSPNAYEKVVDRLLKSPRYGEHMAAIWLDVARYSDSNGYQQERTRTMWPWRDWVIRAFNENMPFDQFTIEQLAGDLLENPTRDQLIATGFNRNHMLNGEGGRIAEESRVNYVIDRVNTTSTTWLGLTMACCQCHDHNMTRSRRWSSISFTTILIMWMKPDGLMPAEMRNRFSICQPRSSCRERPTCEQRLPGCNQNEKSWSPLRKFPPGKKRCGRKSLRERAGSSGNH